MTINSVSKRLASLDYGEVWAEALPIPDGTIGEADRYHSLWSYLLDPIKGSATISDANLYAIALSDALVSGLSLSDASLYAMVLADALVSGLSLTDTGQTGYNGIVLEDGTGYWLFEDGTIISWVTGAPGLVVSDD